MKCTHRPGCDANADYRVFLFLASDGSNPFVHRVEFPHEWRCAHHRTENPEEYLHGMRGGCPIDYWPHLARRFEVRALDIRALPGPPVRARTKVVYVQDGFDVEQIPVMIVRDDGVAEKLADIGVRRARA